MRIIENNCDKIPTIPTEEYICEECNSVFQYDDYDTDTDEYGDEFVICPCCGHKCITYERVTIKNIEFPKSFFQFGTKEDSAHISNELITKDIKKCLGWLKNNPDEHYRYIASGDTFLCVFNHEDEYNIVVAKNYFDSSIDK